MFLLSSCSNVTFKLVERFRIALTVNVRFALMSNFLENISTQMREVQNNSDL